MNVPIRRAVASCWWAAAFAVLSAMPATTPARAVDAPGHAPIQFDVTVRAPDGSPAKGLAASDFSVTEGGTSRPVIGVQEFDAHDSVRGAASWLVDVPRDVATNDLGARRLVLLLVANAAPHARPSLDLVVKAIAHRLLGDLAPDDMAAVVPTASGRSQGFTTDRARLRTAVEAIAIGADETADAAKAIARALDACGAVSGRRKAVIYIGPRSTPLLAKAIDALAADAARANVILDVIDPETGANAPRTKGARTAADHTIVELATRTGGRVVTSGNDPGRDAAAMLRDAGAYYVLSFAPDENARPDESRPVSVVVARTGAVVEARAGYSVPPPHRRALLTLDRAVASALPFNGVRLEVTSAPFAVPGQSRQTVAIAARVRVAPDDTGDGGLVQLVAVAYDADHRAAATVRDVVQLPSAEPREDDGHRGAAGAPRSRDALLRLSLAPGAYELHVAADHAGVFGSVVTSLVVPDVSRAPVSWSGVVVRRAPADPAASAEALVAPAPIVPIVDRVFRTSDEVTVFAQVHQGAHVPLVTVATRITIRDAANRVVFDQPAPFDASRFGAARAVDVRSTLPLSRLTPGEYLLRIEALRGPDSARSDIRFTVE